MLLGARNTGKSSMMKSLIEGTAVLVNNDNPTQVADIQTWEITMKDSIQIFDHGGHDIYRITSPIFIVPNGTIALVHDISQISENKVDDTTAILRHAFTYHPENQVHVVLTHTDLVSTDDAQKNRDFIKAKVHACFDQEIRSFELLTGKDEGRSQLLAQLLKQKDNMEVFLLSSKTFEGMVNLKEFLIKITAEKRVVLPEKWVQFYKLISNQKKNFLKITELEQLSKEFSFVGKPLFQQSKQFKYALEYYRAAGHVVHFPYNPVLEEYVFHNKRFLLRLIQSCFHHNLKDATKFDDLMQTMNASNIDLMLRQYEDEGLLAIELLRFLWHHYGLKEQEERVVLEIMKQFHICYPVERSEKVWFFPYFVKSNGPPASLDMKKINVINQPYFSVLLNCVFNNMVPINAFEAMQVQVQKTAVERQYGNSRYAWHDGILVKIGRLEITALRRASQSTVQLCVCAPIDAVEEVWQVTAVVYSDLEAVLQPLLGVMKQIYFECTHCIVKHLQPVHLRHHSEVLKNKGPDVTFDFCKGDQIPRALVIAPSAGSKKIKEHVRNVQMYLKTIFQETALPGKLLFLDCEEVGEHQFHLSWGWPPSDKEVGPLAEINHAVVEYKEGQQWTKLSDNVNMSPYLVKCNAEEFRVAAVNKNGSGEFSYVTPIHVLQGDRIISDTDMYTIAANHMFFSRITNITEVLQRLLFRGVISEPLKQELLNKTYGEVADQLLEGVIYRSTYRQLYLFKKTLMETGQFVMAETVPVEVKRKNMALQISVTEMPPPGKLLYLDCEEVCENQFNLSWGWPTCDKESGHVANAHAVVEYRVGQQWSRLPHNITKSPCMAECKAEEFKVAVVNEKGTGDFSYVTPFHAAQADEMISDTDRDHMKKNHEFFTRMSNIYEILPRLFRRGVISDLVFYKLNRVENKAEQLMTRVIYRSTYVQLYLFQKTLQETGQSVMAATVPVHMERKHSAAQGPMADNATIHAVEAQTDEEENTIKSEATNPSDICRVKDVHLPGKLLYLDCEEVGENKFYLSWCWPYYDDKTGPIAETTHAVVEYRVGKQWTRFPDNIRSSPYLAECKAEEFKVAAVNKNGFGEFSYVTPFDVAQADAIISENDKESMEKKHELFTRMSNVSFILVRLFTRGVISDLEYERLNTIENKADELMRVIYMSTYKQLYLFQKTLLETSQSEIAAAVPVMLERKPVACHGPMLG